MNDASCTPEGLRHYEVVSPLMTTYHGGYEPPDDGCDWGIYLAKTRTEAKVMAVKSPDFTEWVTEARGDDVPPFKGLEVRLARCDHGVCWGCKATEDSSGCVECDELCLLVDQGRTT